MSLIAKGGGGGNFKPVPPGMHLARCYRIVDLGTQLKSFQGQQKMQHQIMVQFEVHGEDDQGQPLVTSKGEPMTISKNYTLSLADAARLRVDLQTWRGRNFTPEELRGFELKNVLGAWAMISVAIGLGNDGREYTNIMSINPVPSATKKAGLPEGFNPLAIFSLSAPDMAVFETLSKGVQEKIRNSPEWQAINQQKQSKAVDPFEDIDQEIPF